MRIECLKTESYNNIEISRDLTISVQAKLVRLELDLKLSQHFLYTDYVTKY